MNRTRLAGRTDLKSFAFHPCPYSQESSVGVGVLWLEDELSQGQGVKGAGSGCPVPSGCPQ